jgi:GNAT superfamily N-acetyltransferase
MSEAPNQAVHIRPATPSDVPRVHSMIAQLADYERARERAVGSQDLLAQALFGPDSVAEALIAEHEGETAGFALFFRTFSTWLCRPGLWLEDLYVMPEHRRAGIGRLLLARLAEIVIERGYGRLEWTALDWNEPALNFYDSIGAARLEEWRIFRIADEQLEQLARSPARSG